MDFKMQDLKLDMGTTPLENMFLNTYVQMADGDQLKVYLLIYKDCYNYRRVDSAKIKRQLRFSDERFDKAVDFWVNMGVFRQKRADNGTDFIEIVSLRQMYFGDSEDNESTEAAYDLAQRKSIMFSNIETIIERSLTPADITRIQEALLEYNSDPELVTEAFRQAKASGNVDVKYVIGFVKTWRDQNIKSLNDLRMKEERDKLVRKRSPRKYRRNPASARKEASNNDEISSFIQRRKEERFNRIINQRGEDNDS